MNANEKSIERTLERLDATKDEDIDYTDIPPLDPEQFAQAIVKRGLPTEPPRKSQITLRLDTEVLDWFRGQGRGYQTRMNAILKAYKEAQEEAG